MLSLKKKASIIRKLKAKNYGRMSGSLMCQIEKEIHSEFLFDLLTSSEISPSSLSS